MLCRPFRAFSRAVPLARKRAFGKSAIRPPLAAGFRSLTCPPNICARSSTCRSGDADRIITCCGSGVPATNNTFALSMLGNDSAGVDDASMSE